MKAFIISVIKLHTNISDYDRWVKTAILENFLCHLRNSGCFFSSVPTTNRKSTAFHKPIQLLVHIFKCLILAIGCTEFQFTWNKKEHTWFWVLKVLFFFFLCLKMKDNFTCSKKHKLLNKIGCLKHMLTIEIMQDREGNAQ